MKKLVISFVLVLCALSLCAAPGDVAARSVASRSFDIMAGPAWEKARYITFSFNPERDGKIAGSHHHRWDRFTGDYRVAGKNREGRDYVVVFNTNTRKGRGWLDGKEAADPKELIEMGYRRFINDTYWLLMPLKLLDPGTRLESAGERHEECGRVYDVVKLTFDQGVGLTSGDRYWAWVHRDTGMVEYWEMLLQDEKEGDKPTRLRFLEYRRVGGLLLATRKEKDDKSFAIVFGDLSVSEKVREGAFDK